MTPDAEDIVGRARDIVNTQCSHTCESQDEDEPGQPCDCQSLGHGKEIASAFLGAIATLTQIRVQAIAEESRFIERLARECLAGLGVKA